MACHKDKTITLKTGQVLLVSEESMSYFQAREFAAKAGGRLIAHRLLDKCLADKGGRKKGDIGDTEKIENGLGGIFANEIIAYPALNGTFRFNLDITCAKNGFIIPASFVPEEAFFSRNICLFINAGDSSIEERGGKIYLTPERADIIIVQNFFALRKFEGHLHSATGLAVKYCPKTKGTEPRASFMRLSTADEGGGILPVHRHVNRNSPLVNRLEVDARAHPILPAHALVELGPEKINAEPTDKHSGSYDVKF
ncbi:Uncharacterised protein [uncultured archaeon]|nr:Uncharacterised protein [uncultured archaeon]